MPNSMDILAKIKKETLLADYGKECFCLNEYRSLHEVGFVYASNGGDEGNRTPVRR